MIKSYITVALRNLLRHKGYAAINIIGLAIGMATCIVIVRYVQDELSYDGWHEKADRLYRVVRETKGGGQSEFTAGTSGPLPAALEATFPEVEEAVRAWPGFTEVEKGKERLWNLAYAVDPEFFDVFDFPVLRGDLAAVFRDPHAIAVTEKTGKLHFGDEDPIGQTLRVVGRHHGGDKTIAAVLADVPPTSSIQFDYVSGSVHGWEATEVWDAWRPTHGWRPIATYLVLRPGADPRQLQAKLPDFMRRHMGEEISKSNVYHLQPLSRIHLHSREDYGIDFGEEAYGDIDVVYQFAAIAALVLIIGCINFTNLSRRCPLPARRRSGFGR